MTSNTDTGGRKMFLIIQIKLKRNIYIYLKLRPLGYSFYNPSKVKELLFQNEARKQGYNQHVDSFE